ncbi:YqaE/Pmp3 family membrane protein [Paenibacillus hunanensis]|uniref:Uncharacterized membrane protein YqaE (UPF0057 family) n=1 Tax=Paenibacillus hunanensis TaxID=539262 RepID=A0ABU1J5J1_9BACL|nr:YqaE/Pmp3 family membrane protein [Paenibacillus hunanensis]MCL9661032.1 YqaE/Pmp3 family membrane protein [Paenibacillus hunanensis]MDR6246679.1 uncharacterized membrane protein YqaE (UPF0057 family) [Paenibacillus hunanensis]WPP42191.1 YqaE/Pmp3 family membrane protein [Paenibacillus hunanensis]GGJ32443.1 hypothetical protein GCM10008022_46420 [Paenibacillus hunanensis]
MLYILAIFLPPVAVLLCGKPGKAILNLILTLIVWLPGVVHAFIVISQTENEKRNRKMLEDAGRYR